MSSSAGVNQEGTDYSYFAQVLVGSKAQPMYMLLDTGAPTTWVMGSGCKTTACSGHNTFSPADSTSFQDSKKSFSISYGTGSVSGDLAEDAFSFAGLDVPIKFGVANITSDDFIDFPFDGILGLSTSSGATDNFMAVLKAGKKLQSNIFSVSLSRSENVVNDGEITFGAIDPAKHTGKISYTDLSVADGQWAIAMDGMGYDDASAHLEDRDAYIDTGTSYMFGPADDVAALHKLIPGAETADGVTYTVPCSTDKNVSVTFSGVAYPISPLDWVAADGSDRCASNIFGHEVVSGAWLLGDVFLKNVYAVFDVDERRIGFGAKPWAATKAVTATVTTTTSLMTTTLADGSTVTKAAVVTSTLMMAGLSGHETAATAGGTPAAETASVATKAAPMKDSRGGRVGVDTGLGAVAFLAAAGFGLLV